MMISLLSRLGLGITGIALAFAPMSGLAYLTPEQVFGDSGDTFDQTDPSTRPAPPLQRDGDAVVQEQQRRSAEQRAAAQAELQPEGVEPVSMEEEPTLTTTEEQEPRGLFDEDTQYQLRQERAAASQTGGPTIIIRTDGTVTDASGNVLHSGAPEMSGTGPESVLAFSALIIAAFSTFISAQIRARTLALA